MGVYIKGMAMPKTKFECEFWNTDHVCTANMDGVACDPADGIYLPENCPLVEVAEPHGRLVDIDKAIKLAASGVRLEVGELSELTTAIEAEVK